MFSLCFILFQFDYVLYEAHSFHISTNISYSIANTMQFLKFMNHVLYEMSRSDLFSNTNHILNNTSKLKNYLTSAENFSFRSFCFLKMKTWRTSKYLLQTCRNYIIFHMSIIPCFSHSFN